MSDFKKHMMNKYFSHTTIDDIRYGTYRLPYVEFDDLTRCLNRIDMMEYKNKELVDGINALLKIKDSPISNSLKLRRLNLKINELTLIEINN